MNVPQQLIDQWSQGITPPVAVVIQDLPMPTPAAYDEANKIAFVTIRGDVIEELDWRFLAGLIVMIYTDEDQRAERLFWAARGAGAKHVSATSSEHTWRETWDNPQLFEVWSI